MESIMRITKKCGICDYEFTYDNRTYVDPLVAPHDEGAKYYYDLWHYFIEKCPKCGYASEDIAKVVDKSIVKNDWYNAVKDMPILVTLERARPNRIADYLCASVYYDSIGDLLNYAKSMLQASDLVYAEMMYWEEYVLDDIDTLSSVQNKAQYKEFKDFADGLFTKGLEALENYVQDFTNDIDAMILLAGTLITGSNLQKIKGTSMLSKLKGVRLTAGQKKALEYLMNKIN
jgi:hypothetical protein